MVLTPSIGCWRQMHTFLRKVPTSHWWDGLVESGLWVESARISQTGGGECGLSIGWDVVEEKWAPSSEEYAL